MDVDGDDEAAVASFASARQNAAAPKEADPSYHHIDAEEDSPTLDTSRSNGKT